MIYNTKEKTLRDERKLSDKEDKLLRILSCNEIVEISKIKRELNIKKEDNFSLDIVVAGLRYKGLDIKNMSGKGYRLFDEIYFE